MRGRRFEISTYGPDDNLELIGSSPYGGASALGLPIPSAPTTSPKLRYLFMLAQFKLGPSQKARVVGLRQYLAMGTLVVDGGRGGASYPLTQEITSPYWHFTDGNVSWHLTRMEPTEYMSNNLSNTEAVQFRMSDTPSRLFQQAAPDYIPPNGGRPYGQAIDPQLKAFTDLRYPWRGSTMQYLDAEVEGPCRVVLWASVWQTDPATRTRLTLAGTETVSPEDQFVVDFPQAIYTRVGGSIIVEMENMISMPRDLIEMVPAIDQCGNLDPRMDRRGG